MDKIRIACFDDHPLMLDGLAQTLTSESDFIVVGRGTSAADAVGCARAEKPDVILLDVDMPGGGLNVLRCIADAYPAVKIVMLTVSMDPEHVSRALRSGIHGYVLKGVSGPELIEIVRTIYKGTNYWSPGVAAHLLSSLQYKKADADATTDHFDELTARELQVLELISQGLTNKEIGTELSLTEKTVKHYVTTILQKLHVRNRVEAALLARPRITGKQGRIH